MARQLLVLILIFTIVIGVVSAAGARVISPAHSVAPSNGPKVAPPTGASASPQAAQPIEHAATPSDSESPVSETHNAAPVANAPANLPVADGLATAPAVDGPVTESVPAYFGIGPSKGDASTTKFSIAATSAALVAATFFC